MIQTIFILSGIIMLLSGISFFVIKKLRADKKSLQFKVDFAEKQMKSQNENIANYKTIIVKLNNKKVESETVKKNISSASGAILSKLANSL